VAKLLVKLSAAYDGGLGLFCYEDGPCGYVFYRQILASGHECDFEIDQRVGW
jgi:transposase